MINRLVSLFLFVLIAQIGFAQIRETNSPMSKGTQNAFELELYNQNANEIESTWITYVQQRYKSQGHEMNETTNEILIKDISIEGMEQLVNVYARIQKDQEKLNFIVWFDLGESFLSSKKHPRQFSVAIQMLEKFDLHVKQKLGKTGIEIEKKRLEALASEFHILQIEHRRIKTEMSNLEKESPSLKQKLSENELKQVEIQKAMKAQEKKVESAIQKYRGIK